HVQYRKGKDPLKAAIDGASEMIVPVTFGVCTTLAAFLPLLAVPGVIGKMFQVVPLVVIPTLIFSLIEVFFILPAHLSHRGESKYEDAKGPVNRFFRFFESGFDKANQRLYQPVLRLCLSWRYVSLSAGLMILLLVFGLVGGGRISFTFFPEVEADNVLAVLKMPLGTPAQETARVVARLEAAAEEVRQEFDSKRGPAQPSVYRHILSTIGSQPTVADSGPGGSDPTANPGGGHLAEINIELASSQYRQFPSEAVAERWRELAGPVPGATELRFTSALFTAGDPINIQLVGPDVERLRQAAERLKELVQRYPGVFDAAHSFQAGKQEIRLNTTEKAQQLGISELDLARQVRQAFHGEEAQRVQRGKDDVKVMVRYPKENRRSIGELENMRIRLSEGREIPFSTVAQAEFGTGFSSIRRVDRRRAVNLTANVDTARVTANQILTEVEANDLPLLMEEFPEIRYSLEGEQREQRETLQALGRGLVLALLLIFALMAVPLRSYFQPLLIMTAIPFGCVGAVLGHLHMGHDLSILSMFGMVALAGVVVNANLVLIDYINRRYREGVPRRKAVQEAGAARFRPVLLTALTTFGGLTPLLAEQSLQAQFLIPMAISLAFGVLFSTGVSLLLVPALYLIHEDVRELFAKATGIPLQEGTPPLTGEG
ncbi:MAG TPA: efflux RND transporter permease subunit, partial [Acidobacteriota bacterium]|nr:efflux RND transporter permease subunit [Acidobacteriota bacterium]